jgi:hypothetical protein
MDTKRPTDSSGKKAKFTGRDLEPEKDWQMPFWMARRLGFLVFALLPFLLLMLTAYVIGILRRLGFK